MTAPTVVSQAALALDQIVEALQDAGIAATRDPGAFFPQPTGVLVGLPTLTKRGLQTSTFTVPVLVVSGDPLNSLLAADRLLEQADRVALVLETDNYRPSQWRSSVNAEPLPALEVTVTVTVTEGAPL